MAKKRREVKLEGRDMPMMLWHACKMAKAMGVPIHIIDRCGEMDENMADYYYTLGGETGFKQVQFDAMEAEAISDGRGTVGFEWCFNE